MTRRKILVADLLCGAGGSSTGCERALRALGLEMELVCVNHWPTAIETHQKNHPQARHYVQDIATVRPHLLVPEGRLDLLMASPTCTHHSVARGGKPTSDQQRSDPWHIVTWLTELRVKRIIIENVWEFTGWGPVDPRTGKPIAARKGEYFRAWIETIRRLGFEPEWRKLNAADYGDATTRQRFILMARSDGRPVQWPVPTHAKRMEGSLALFPGLKPWKPAREIIDWSIKGKSIFGRKKPLAPKTLARIYAGAVKFAWPEPFLVILRNHMAGQSIDGPVPAIAANGGHIGLAEPVAREDDELPPFREWIAATRTVGGTRAEYDKLHEALAEPVVVRTNMHGRKSPGARGVWDPLMTLTTDGGIAVAEPVFLGPPASSPAFVAGNRTNNVPKSTGEPLPCATTTTGGGIMLVEPFVLSQQTSGQPRSAEDPLPTITTGGAGTGDHPGCARPMIVEPFILSRHADGAPRSIDEPTPTQVAKQSHVLLAPYYGGGSGETCGSAEDPLATVTAKGRFGMVVPITHSDGSDRARSVDDPLATITTAHRGELAFITAQHGEREGQTPRVHGIEDPAPTIAATGHIDLAQGVVIAAQAGTRQTAGSSPAMYDVLFRMLEPHELAAAMGFTCDDAAYEFAGTKTEQIRQIGNAVSVAKMKACVGAIMADAAPRAKRQPETPSRKEQAA